MEPILRALNDDKQCVDVLQRLAAARGSINSLMVAGACGLAAGRATGDAVLDSAAPPTSALRPAGLRKQHKPKPRMHLTGSSISEDKLERELNFSRAVQRIAARD